MLGSHGQNSQQWSADFVQHIRTVHFSLVAVCVALIGAVATVKPREINSALSQLVEIRRATDNWETEIRTAFHGGTITNVDGPRIKVKGRCFVLSRNATFLGESRGFRWNIEKSLERPPASLPAFCSAWDRLHTLPELFIPEQNQVVKLVMNVDRNGQASTLPYTLDATEASAPVSVSPLTDVEQRAIAAPNVLTLNLLTPDLAKTSYGYSWEVKGVHLLVPVTGKKRHVQEAIIGIHPAWRRGFCSDSFAELIKEAKDSPDQSLVALASDLKHSAVKEKADSYSVFGMEFPVEGANWWGIVLVIGIQFYLWINLHEVSPRVKHDDPGWEVAWIGVYRSVQARVLFIVLTVSLPVVTIFVLGNGLFARDKALRTISTYGAAALSLMLSGLITMLAQQLWERDPDLSLNSD
jgi:hypothetical protein